MKRFTLKLAVLTTYFCVVGTVMAANYRLDFSGTVYDTSELYSGYAILDYNTPNSSNDQSLGSYLNAITEFEIQIAGAIYTLIQTEESAVTVHNDDGFFGFDALGISLYLTDSVDNSDSELFLFQLIDSTMSAFSGTELPTILSIDDFDLDQSDITVTYVSTVNSHPLNFVSIVPVPLPAGLLLLLSVLSSLIAVNYRKR